MKIIATGKWHIISIIALLALLAVILIFSPTSDLLDFNDKKESKEKLFPSSYLIKTKTTQYNANGDITHILTADKVSYFDTNSGNLENYALLDFPIFTFFGKADEATTNSITSKDTPWKASSDHGRSTHNHEQFLLTGNVTLEQINPDSKKYTVITSEELLIIPKQRYAETKKPVTIKNESGVTTSIGLKISLDTETIELLSNVRSRYEAP